MTKPANARQGRADAVRNRAHIVSVAREAFADAGVELAMDAIAKRAGLGAGTLYRHFPTRELLVAAVLEERFHELERERVAIEEGESHSLRALERWLDAVSAWMRAYEGLTAPLSLAHGSETSPLAPTCQQVIDGTEQFLKPAQRDGYARDGLHARDLFMATLAVAWATDTTAEAGGGASGVSDILRSGWAVSQAERSPRSPYGELE